MRISFSTNHTSCQPLRNFGKAEHKPKNTPSNATNPAFSSTVSREDYNKLNEKYDLLSRMAIVQLDQYNQLAAKYRAATK